MIFKNLLRRKLRTAFSILGVGVGISVMVALFTMSEDVLSQFTDILATQRGDLIGVQVSKEIYDSNIELAPGGKDLLKELRAEPNVKDVHPFIWAYLQTERPIGPAGQVDYLGVTENSPVIRNFEIVETTHPGEPLIDDDDPNGFVAGADLVALANKNLPPEDQLRVGQKAPLARLLTKGIADYFYKSSGGKKFADLPAQEQLELLNEKLKKAGVDPMAAIQMKDLYLRATFRAKQTVSNYAIYFPLVRVQQLKAMPGHCSALIVELDDNDDAAKDAAVKDLNRRYDRLHIKRSDKIIEDRAEIDLTRDFSWGISIVAALAGAMGVLNTMLLAVMERTREIGLLRALGWGRWRIMWGLVGEGLVITTLGGLLGSLLGYLEVVGVRWYFDLTFLNPGISPKLTAVAVAMAFVLGLIASLYPAWRASRLTPMDALRHE